MKESSIAVALYHEPIVAVTLTSAGGEVADKLQQQKNMLVYSTPEKAAKILSKLYEYQRHLDKTLGKLGKK